VLLKYNIIILQILINFGKIKNFVRCSGGSAIWMDENVRYGKSGYCETFDNPPLCPNGDFEIQVLEVYGFTGL
jgi:TLD